MSFPLTSEHHLCHPHLLLQLLPSAGLWIKIVDLPFAFASGICFVQKKRKKGEGEGGE
jgi:hypothetical protein